MDVFCCTANEKFLRHKILKSTSLGEFFTVLLWVKQPKIQRADVGVALMGDPAADVEPPRVVLVKPNAAKEIIVVRPRANSLSYRYSRGRQNRREDQMQGSMTADKAPV